jgi:CBS domain-containing protein
VFDHKHYVPILKGKEAEFSSLGLLTAQQRSIMTPLIEVQPVAWDYVKEELAKDPRLHLESAVEKIYENWGTENRIFVDLMHMDPEMLDSKHSLEVAFDSLREHGVNAVPVTSLTRTPQYQEAIMTTVKRDGRGMCLRLRNEDLIHDGDITDKIDDILSINGIVPEDVDLMLDMEYVQQHQQPSQILTLPMLFSSIPYLTRWRSLTYASASFPENLSDLGPNTVTKLPRTEWGIWLNLIKSGKIQRLPAFADYPISNPELPEEIDPRLMKMSVNLRYTIENEWLVFKGRLARKYGFEQFRDQCRALVDMPEYYGEEFSWGDNYISECAQGNAKSGNATTWRKVGVTHHIAVVSSQISNLT